jgi:hypothetical protein
VLLLLLLPRLTVQATPEGLRRFGKQVEIITGQPFSDEMDVRFFCKSPTGVWQRSSSIPPAGHQPAAQQTA